MIGAPGVGKSYYIEQHKIPSTLVISRDKIRFSMLEDGDEYFSKEKAVYNEFINQINMAIERGETFYVDQTSLTRASRNKLFSRLKIKPTFTTAIYLKSSLDKILMQNARRTGRAYVPEDAIINMYNSIEEPKLEEGFDEIWTIER
jgi:predicted kinase